MMWDVSAEAFSGYKRQLLITRMYVRLTETTIFELSETEDLSCRNTISVSSPERSNVRCLCWLRGKYISIFNY